MLWDRQCEMWFRRQRPEMRLSSHYVLSENHGGYRVTGKASISYTVTERKIVKDSLQS